MSGWFAGPGYRDEFTPEQEREMDEQQAREELCECEPAGFERGTSPTCPVHGDPEVIEA